MCCKGKSLSKAIGPWKQKPQTHTSWRSLFQLIEEPVNQKTDDNRSSILFINEKLQLLCPVVHSHTRRYCGTSLQVGIHHYQLIKRQHRKTHNLIQSFSVRMISSNASSFVFLSSYNITIAQMNTFQSGITHSKSPFSTSMWESNSSGVFETTTDDSLEPISVCRAVRWNGLRRACLMAFPPLRSPRERLNTYTEVLICFTCCPPRGTRG